MKISAFLLGLLAFIAMSFGIATATPVSTATSDTTVTINVGGTWDGHSQFVWPLTSAFYTPPKGGPVDNINYGAGGFDPSDILKYVDPGRADGMTYNQSRTSGEVGATAAIEDAVKNGEQVGGKGFSQGADAIIGGARAAIQQGGVDPAQVSIQAMASPVQPVTGLRNRMPFDLPGISRGDGGDAGGAAVQWYCVGRDIVCHAPSDLDPVKWANAAAEYWLVHAANGRGCTYAALDCDNQTSVRVEGNQTFTQVTAEAGLVQMADNAGIALPEAVKNFVRDDVADGDVAYRPSILAPTQTAHDFLDSLGLDRDVTTMLDNAVSGLFSH